MTADASQNDGALLRRAARGDLEAFAMLYRRHQGGIYRFALRMSKDGAAAEEVTQEVFMALLREPQRYDAGKGSLGAYLYGIARRQVLKYYGRESGYLPLEDAKDSAAGAVEAPPGFERSASLLAELERDETIALVREAVGTLPPNYREVVALCDLEEMSYEEAAAALGCAVGTVRSRLHRARALLLAKLEILRGPARKVAAG